MTNEVVTSIDITFTSKESKSTICDIMTIVNVNMKIIQKTLLLHFWPKSYGLNYCFGDTNKTQNLNWSW